MEEAQVESSSVPAILTPVPAVGRRRLWVRGLAALAMSALLLGYIAPTGRSLWGEWVSLRRDQDRERASVVVGYVNINPNVSYASRPKDWSHDEGDDSLLWAGWKDGKNHWFRFGRGQFDASELSMPIGRDVIRAIDEPLYEQAGGPRWGRVPPEAPVVGFERDGSAIAYPMKVLQKVLVVNDHVGDRPVLVAYTPEGAVSVYEATLDGRRVTLGHGGYFRGYHPIFYDRGTQSLWSEEQGGMIALAGLRKGASLKRVANPQQVAWSDWKDGHPAGRLLIGADRSKALPAD